VMDGSSSTTRMVGAVDWVAGFCGPDMVKFLYCSIVLDRYSGERIEDFGNMDWDEWKGACWADRLLEAESSDYFWLDLVLRSSNRFFSRFTCSDFSWVMVTAPGAWPLAFFTHLRLV